MFRVRCWLSAALTIGMLSVGCGRDESESTSAEESPNESPAAQTDDAAAMTEEAPAPDAAAGSAEPVQTRPIKDIALAPSADEEPDARRVRLLLRQGQSPRVAEFHKKDLESKGWKTTRNDVNKLPGTTLGGAIQQFEKGSDVLTVVAAEQVAEGDAAMVGVMDIPLPPRTLYAIAYGGQMNGETAEPPADVIAWMTRDLTARGWKASKPQDVGGTHAVNFTKDQRTLSTQFRPAGAVKQGSTFYFMHVGY